MSKNKKNQFQYQHVLDLQNMDNLGDNYDSIYIKRDIKKGFCRRFCEIYGDCLQILVGVAIIISFALFAAKYTGKYGYQSTLPRDPITNQTLFNGLPISSWIFHG